MVANVLGAALGVVLCILSPIDVRSAAKRVFAAAQRSRALLFAALAIAAVPSLTILSQSQWFDFQNWDRRFTFQLANEATLNRPWLGTFFLAAIYNRALSAEEVAKLYDSGLSAEPKKERSNKSLVALYAFDEGYGAEVRDISEYRTPLNLQLEPRARFRWLEDRPGIEIVRPAVLKSRGAADKLFDALTESGEMSLEVWLMPSRRVQAGPARIASFSLNTQARNFTMGQQGRDIEFRLRTPATGSNGTPLSLRTTTAPVIPRQSHLFITYKEGIERLYIDGRKYPEDLNLKDSAILTFGARKTLFAQLAYIMVYFFPVSFFFAFVLSSRVAGYVRTVLVPAAVSLCLLTLTEGLHVYLFDRSVDLFLLACGVVLATLGALTGVSVANGFRRANLSTAPF